jgi:hypothetical protein
MPTLLSLTNDEAKSYFLEATNYVSFDLPPYFTFDEILQKTATYMNGKGIHEFFEATNNDEKTTKLNPADFEGVNYKLIGNKDGEYAWRPYEIIHPALYIALVNEITSRKSWSEIIDRFAYFSKSAVLCESIPFVSDDEEKHKAHQIKRWWTNVEQASLKQSLHFKFVYDVDIADCYGSIYTHSIAWALHGKDLMKQKRGNLEYLGNRIDVTIQKMRFRQTNGIPQGSAIMDFIAEMALGNIDVLLTQRLDDLRIHSDDYSIIRFRDDYKIFTNNPEIGKNIVKELSSILSGLSMKLNTAKTKQQVDPVIASIKPDKLHELFVPNNRMSLSKRLLQIYECSNLFPNSGLITRQLNNYYRHIEKTKKLNKYDDPMVMIGIVVNLAIKNPKSYQWSMAILSHLLTFCKSEDVPQIVTDIREKFETVPNTGLLDIWLQRISYKVDPSIKFSEMLTLIASRDYMTNLIWKSSWLEAGLRDIIANTPIIEEKLMNEMTIKITPKEVALFNFPY